MTTGSTPGVFFSDPKMRNQRTSESSKSYQHLSMGVPIKPYKMYKMTLFSKNHKFDDDHEFDDVFLVVGMVTALLFHNSCWVY